MIPGQSAAVPDVATPADASSRDDIPVSARSSLEDLWLQLDSGQLALATETCRELLVSTLESAENTELREQALIITVNALLRAIDAADSGHQRVADIVRARDLLELYYVAFIRAYGAAPTESTVVTYERRVEVLQAELATPAGSVPEEKGQHEPTQAPSPKKPPRPAGGSSEAPRAQPMLNLQPAFDRSMRARTRGRRLFVSGAATLAVSATLWAFGRWTATKYRSDPGRDTRHSTYFRTQRTLYGLAIGTSAIGTGFAVWGVSILARLKRGSSRSPHVVVLPTMHGITASLGF